MIGKIIVLFDLLAVPRAAFRHRSLLWQMTRRNIETRYRGSMLGLVWSFIQPLMMLVVYTFVFSVVFQARWGTDIAGVSGKGAFAVIMFCGMAMFNLFSEAVNEAITNAVAHRDYSISESKIRIHMFCDRIEIFSPGALPNSMTVEELSERQFSRNELICTCLSRCPLKEDIPDVARTTIMDRRGEGVPVILGASRALSKKTPEYRLIDGCELKLTIRDAQVAMNENLYGRKVTEKATEKVTEKPLEDRVLVAIAKNPNQAQREMAALLGVNRTYLARVMSAMQKKGLIRRVGPDKGGHWEVVYA